MRRRSLVYVPSLSLLLACGGGQSPSGPIGTSDLATPSDAGPPIEDAAASLLFDATAPMDASRASSESDPLVIREDGVGPFRIGMKTKEVRAIKKFRVEEVTKRVDGENEKVLTAFDHDNELLEFSTKAGKLSSILIVDRRFHTDKGIGLGAKASAVEAAYGKPSSQYTLEGETCFFFGPGPKLHFCFKAGGKTWESFSKKGKTLTSFIISDG